MKYSILHSLILIFIVSCQNVDRQKTNDVSTKLDSLLSENKKLNDKISKIEKDKESIKDIKSTQTQSEINSTQNSSNSNSSSNDFSDNGITTNKKYAFVLLSIVKKEFNREQLNMDLEMERTTGKEVPEKGYRFENYSVTSKIQTFNNFNEDIKYKFIDDVQNNLKNSAIALNMESVKNRQCFVFNTYKEASIARAKYTTEE